MQLYFHNSHAYPGCTVTIGQPTIKSNEVVTAEAIFEDGAIAEAECEGVQSKELRVHVGAYRTRAGSSIARKCWIVELIDADSNLWRVKSQC